MQALRKCHNEEKTLSIFILSTKKVFNTKSGFPSIPICFLMMRNHCHSHFPPENLDWSASTKLIIKIVLLPYYVRTPWSAQEIYVLLFWWTNYSCFILDLKLRKLKMKSGLWIGQKSCPLIEASFWVLSSIKIAAKLIMVEEARSSSDSKIKMSKSGQNINHNLIIYKFDLR